VTTIDDKAKAALQQPDTQAVSLEMTPERCEKYQRLTGSLIDLLKANTDSPLEAYMILHFAMQSFEESYGIRGGFSVGHEGPES
jgi:hypothetical protein